MSLTIQVSNLATRVATEFKLVKGWIGSLGSLTTTDKTSLVAAINEVKATVGAQIDDSTPSTTKTYSSSKTNSQIASAVAGLVASAPGALDTLDELANALGDDANFATTMTTALGNRVRVDTATQGLSAAQQSNARANISVYSKAELGDPETDYVAVFNAGLA